MQPSKPPNETTSAAADLGQPGSLGAGRPRTPHHSDEGSAGRGRRRRIATRLQEVSIERTVDTHERGPFERGSNGPGAPALAPYRLS